MGRVLIVGGGLVALALSVILARYRVPATILTRDPARPHNSAGNSSGGFAWLPPGLDLLDWLGLAEGFVRQGSWRSGHELWSGGRRRLVLPYARPDTPHGQALDLPEHQAEALLEAAALATGLVEIRRGHAPAALLSWDGEAGLRVRGPEGEYEIAADYAVACGPEGAVLRDWLGIPVEIDDLGVDALAADLETTEDQPLGRSRLVLDCVRPHAFFPFAARRIRFLTSVNPGEKVGFSVAPQRMAVLVRALRPDIAVRRVLWSHPARQRALHSRRFRRGRWLLAGEAANTIDAAGGAHQQFGLMGAWRLGWRLALAAQGHARGSALLDDYDREQRATTEAVRRGAFPDLPDLGLRSRASVAVRTLVLGIADRLPFLARRLAEATALESRTLPMAGSADRPYDGPWRMPGRIGPWRGGARLPAAAFAGVPPGNAEIGLRHLILPVGQCDPAQEASLARALRDRLQVPGIAVDAGADAPWRVRGGPPALALIRPDRRVVALYSV
ncbi:FAD-dependent monooxygenase [Arenibaculum pallidiluteum]|uniref:FAD-dependent monooxygenase n=1 Tax=Arenibaculum pallidiluteum TaxID=2812559 RepID=UPI001A96EAEE|nr:FAD-dependent monooxygenase [Arenibaculum pallidiluteum]